MISKPDPSSFEVGVGVTGQVDGQKRSKALTFSDVVLRALGQLKFGPGSASEADIGIPHSSTTLSFRIDVPLEDDGASGCSSESCQSGLHGWGCETRTRATSRENDASDFSNALTTVHADLDDNPWIIDVVELAPSTGDDSPGFAKDTNPGWNLQGVRHQIGPGIEEDYLASRELSKSGEISRKR